MEISLKKSRRTHTDIVVRPPPVLKAAHMHATLNNIQFRALSWHCRVIEERKKTLHLHTSRGWLCNIRCRSTPQKCICNYKNLHLTFNCVIKMRARVSRFLYSASYFFAVMMMLGQHHKKQSKNHERAEARHISYQLISFDPRTYQPRIWATKFLKHPRRQLELRPCRSSSDKQIDIKTEIIYFLWVPQILLLRFTFVECRRSGEMAMSEKEQEEASTVDRRARKHSITIWKSFS